MSWFDNREIRALGLFIPLMLLVGVGWFVVEVRRMDHRAGELQRQEELLPADSVELFFFDPNTISYDSLKLLGFSKTQARQLLHYRSAGKVYRMAEDLDGIYGMTDSLFQRIRPYVRIGAEYAFQPRSRASWHDFPAAPRRSFRAPDSPIPIDSLSEDRLRAMGFSVRWSKAFVDCHRRRGIRSLEEMRELNFIGDSITDLLAPWILFPVPEADPFDEPLELNRADSAALRSVYGIGEKSVMEIIRYRERLGGFHRVEQLAEVRGVTEANYEKILQQIWCDSFQIQKIDINFAPAERIKEHPYVAPRTFRKLISKRQQRKSKGGWSTVEEMVEENILTPDEAQRLRPYLRFGTQESE